MKIFISWSGNRGKHVAEALRDWLLFVIHDVEPWMSASDIEAGARWNAEIAKQLEATHFGIICLTKESLNAPWLLFEAGALAKSIGKAHVCPFLVDLEPAEISGPLVQFQGVKAEKEATWKLVQSIYRALEKHQLTEPQFRRLFDRFWPDLEEALRKLPPSTVKTPSARSDRSILEEVLETVRGLARSTSAANHSSSTMLGHPAVVNVDVSEATGHAGSVAEFPVVPADSRFQSLLNWLFFQYLSELVPALTYGKTWTLVDPSTHRTITKIGELDERPLKELGIEPGALLKLVMLERPGAATRDDERVPQGARLSRQSLRRSTRRK